MKNLFILLLVFVICACHTEREEKITLRISGAYNIEIWKVTQQDANGDFTAIVNEETDCGNVILNKTGENETVYQKILFYPKAGKSMYFACAKFNSVIEPYFWEMETEIANQMVIWNLNANSNHTYASVYLIKRSHNKITLTGIFGTTGSKYKEEIVLKRHY